MARSSAAPPLTQNPSIGPEGEALVLVQNASGEELYVNPATLKAHMEAGWKPV